MPGNRSNRWGVQDARRPLMGIWAVACWISCRQKTQIKMSGTRTWFELSPRAPKEVTSDFQVTPERFDKQVKSSKERGLGLI